MRAKTMSDLKIWSFFLILRIVSVFVVSTWFVPDEYWQSLEVAHKLIFGYGYLTWEWTKGIRSYIHPGMIAILYKVLQMLGLDDPTTLTYIPRLLQAVLSAYADMSFWKWSGKTKWALFCIASSWFWFYLASRTLINTVETCLTTIALSKFPFQKFAKHQRNPEDEIFLLFVGMTVAIRPTAAILWLPLCAYHVFTSRTTIRHTLLHLYVPAVFIIFVVTTAFDSLMHGSFIITWWEFLKLNLFEGVGEWYGSQPWHWYLSQGMVVVLGVHLFPFLIASLRVLKYRHDYVDELALLASVTFTVFVFSCLGHKEFRFLLPIVPIALYISAQFLSNWSRKASDLLVWIVAIFLFVGNAVPGIYFSVMHQKGNLEVMKPLHEIAKENPHNANFLFLMPCHSTPLYSHLHQNVTTRFLTCNPNLSKVDNYVDEADYFYDVPSVWIRNNYPSNKPLPTHIISFDVLVPQLTDILSRYKPIHRIHNTDFVSDARVGRYIIIHELIDNKNTAEIHEDALED